MTAENLLTSDTARPVLRAATPTRTRRSLAAFAMAAAAALSACGGGGSDAVAGVASGVAANAAASAAAGAASSVAIAVGASSTAADTDLVSNVNAPTYAAGSTTRGAWTLLMAQRALCGFGVLQQDARLDTAAAAHASYMTQNSVARNTLVSSHSEDTGFLGFYASTPAARAARAGYPNQVAEILTEQATYYSAGSASSIVAGEALGASSMMQLLETVYHLSLAMYPGRSGGVGASVQTGAYTTPGTNQTVASLVADIGADTPLQKLGTGVVATWPCNGVTGVTGKFAPAFESPQPFADVTSTATVYGTPIYFKADAGATLTVTNVAITKLDGTALTFRQLTRANDTNAQLGSNEVFIVPTTRLLAGSTYTVAATGTINGGAFTKLFSFSTTP